jgi:hypothetical protein
VNSLRTERARKRPWYVLALIVVIAMGLASRRFPALFPTALGKYPGDALWALMVFLDWGILFPRSSTIRILFYALATSVAVEFFKLYHSGWMDGIRSTTLGHLIFGYAFSWGNLVAYAVGIGVGALGEAIGW